MKTLAKLAQVETLMFPKIERKVYRCKWCGIEFLSRNKKRFCSDGCEDTFYGFNEREN